MATTAPVRPTASAVRRAFLKRVKFLIPMLLLALVGTVVANVLMVAPRTPPTSLGGSVDVGGGLARILGVVPTETDGWMPPEASTAFASPPDDELHRVRILVELTAMEESGLSFDPDEYAVSALGGGTWKAVWSAPAPAQARQGETIDAVLVFELPDRAIDLTLEVPGGAGLALGPGHHRGGS